MNALLEGDVGRVGVLGIGSQPDLRAARKRTRVGSVALAPGHSLETEHAFVDVTRGIDQDHVDAALETLAAAGCASIAVSGALAVDEPGARAAGGAMRTDTRAPGLRRPRSDRRLRPRDAHGQRRRQREHSSRRPADGIPRRAGARGRRTRRAAARPPRRRRRDERRRLPPPAVLHDRLRVLPRASRRRLHQLGLADAIVVECGGTSSNVSVVKGGRPVVRSLRVMGRPTCVRAVDSWVVGAAGGSMALLKRRSIDQTGPRSAHIAGLPYACFADPSELVGAQLELVAPRDGDPELYACVRAGGKLYALTVTCAANALGLVAADCVLVRGPGGGAGRIRPARRAAEDDAGGRRTAAARRSGREDRQGGRGCRAPPRPSAGRAARRAGRRGRGARSARGRAPEAPADPARASRGALLDRRGDLARPRRGDAQRDEQRRRGRAGPRSRACLRRLRARLRRP